MKPRVIKVAIWDIDAEISERKYARMKLKENIDVYNVEARNAFVKSKVITSIIKYAYGINLYGVRNSMINNQMCRSECL